MQGRAQGNWQRRVLGRQTLGHPAKAKGGRGQETPEGQNAGSSLEWTATVIFSLNTVSEFHLNPNAFTKYHSIISL